MTLSLRCCSVREYLSCPRSFLHSSAPLPSLPHHCHCPILYRCARSCNFVSIIAEFAFKMALPVVKSVYECSDLSKTVLPYVSQLYDLPQQLLQSYSNPVELRNIYLATNPLISAFAFSLFLSPLFLVVSEINKNYSQVDRCWSILPTIYNAHFVLYAHLSGLPTQRLDNLLAVSTVWSVSSPVIAIKHT
jgi:hypothetical protein